MSTLVAGIGNLLMRDDGFGVEVARRLECEHVPPGVEVADYGIRGVHLAYQLLEGYDTLILVDAMARGEQPGTLTVLELDVASLDAGGVLDAHTMDPATVLGMLRDLGGRVDRVLIVGCEPEHADEGIGLSPIVEAVVDDAVRVVLELVAQEPARLGGDAA